MTYCEAHVAEKNSIDLVHGEWKQTIALFMFGHVNRHQLFKESNNECI